MCIWNQRSVYSSTLSRTLTLTFLMTATLMINVTCLMNRGLAGDHWPQFRGPDATGVVQATTNLPETWSAEDNIAWKQDIPGRGWSSPIVWGNRIFLTTVINSEETEAAKKGLYFGGNRPKPPESDHQWQVLCLELDTGKELWRRTVHEGKPTTSIHVKNSFASETPTTDGKHVYVVFGGVGIFCLDMNGNEVWKKAIEPAKTRYGWGFAASPILHQDRLYLLNDNDEASSLLALDKHTGEEIWRVKRDEKSNWSTPYVWSHAKGTEIVVPATGRVVSYGLDGQEKWSLFGMSSITIATPYEHQGLLILSSGYVGDPSRPLYAIRPGATGDISLAEDAESNDHIAWCQPTGAPYNPSTIAYDGIIYVLHDRGLMAAYDAKTGEEIYSKQRIPKGRSFTSSPWAYNGKLFCLNEDGETFVIKAGRDFELLHSNSLEEDDMGMATPAIVGDRVLIRTAARLYCIRNNE
ncbi:MAG: PQQ-binding-like beta-propeller repeat protein [Rubripirellula sp.]|nr:PQQ-binding-like beta-propeller repeat protein [Rubripirellula sp.]